MSRRARWQREHRSRESVGRSDQLLRAPVADWKVLDHIEQAEERPPLATRPAQDVRC